MRKRYWIFLPALLLTLPAFWFFRLPAPPPDPVYHGKPLSKWLEQMDTGSWPRTTYCPADDAVRAISTKALPLVNQMLRARDSWLKSKLIALSWKQPILRIHFIPARQLHHRALAACYVSDSLAIGALPAISELMVSQDYDNQPFPVNLLAHLKSGAEPAIPALLQMLENTNNPVRSWASSALWQIHRQPSLVIPALTKSLADTNQFVRFESARALGVFGPEAKAALPPLLALLKDTNPTVCMEAGAAILLIDSAVAAKVGIFEDPHIIR